MTPMSIHEPSNTPQALPLCCRATLASIRSRPLCYSPHLQPVPEITSIKSGLTTPQNLSNNAILQLLYLTFPSHLQTFISLFTIQYLCKSLLIQVVSGQDSKSRDIAWIGIEAARRSCCNHFSWSFSVLVCFSASRAGAITAAKAISWLRKTAPQQKRINFGSLAPIKRIQFLTIKAWTNWCKILRLVRVSGAWKQLEIKFKLLFLLRPCALMTPASVQHQVCGGLTGSTSWSTSSSQETAEIAKTRASFPTNTSSSFTFERTSVALEVAPTENQSKLPTRLAGMHANLGPCPHIECHECQMMFYPSFWFHIQTCT